MISQSWMPGKFMHSLKKLALGTTLRAFWTPRRSVLYARLLGVRIADSAEIFNGVDFGSEPWLVEIGPGSRVTTGVCFITHDGSTSVVKRLMSSNEALKANRYGRIRIGSNCFIGVRSIIMPGVSIGDNCIIAAGSVVTKDVEGGKIVAGNPARTVSEIEAFKMKVLSESLLLPSKFVSASHKKDSVLEALSKRQQ